MPRSREILLPWDSQPQEAVPIDAGLAARVLFAYHPPSGGMLSESKKKETTGARPIVPTSQGLAAQFTGLGSQTIGVTGTTDAYTSGLSFLIVARRTAATNIENILSRGSVGASGGIELDLRNAFASGNFILGRYRDGATTKPFDVGYVNGVANNLNSSYPTVTGTFYSISGRADSIPSNAGDFTIGAVSTFYAKADVALVVVFDTGLPNETLRALSENPWQLFAPQTIWVPVSAGGGGTTVTAADETDAAFGLSAVQIKAVGQASETDSALALSAVQSRAVGRADEIGAAFALVPVQLAPIGLATETDTALALSAGVANGVGLASETDTAFALAAVQIKSTGLAAEVDTALALTGVTGTAPGIATESDTAFALVAVQKMLVGIASEVDTALALSPAAAPGDDLALILKILRNRQELNPTTGKFVLYDDDGITVLLQSDAWADVAGTQPYSGGYLARIDALV